MMAATLSVGLMLLSPAEPSFALDVSGLTHLDGSEVEADEMPQNAILVFFSTWSPKCRGIVRRVNAIHAGWGGKATVFLVDFQENRSAVEKFLDGKSLDVEVLRDPKAAFSKKHGITYLPSVLAVKDGTPALRGKLPSDPDPVLSSIYD